MPPCRQTSVAPRSRPRPSGGTTSCDVQDVGVAAQVEALGPREKPEAAAAVALVDVVDVAVDHVGDRVAAARARAGRRRPSRSPRPRIRGRGRGARSRPPAAACPRASARGCAASSGRQPPEALIGGALAPGASSHSADRRRAGPAAPRRGPGPRCSAGGPRPAPSIWCRQAVNSGRASASRASSISVSGGRAVRSTSGRGAMASRRAPTCSGLQSPTTRSTGAGGDGVEGPLERGDLHRDAGRDPRQPPSSMASSRPA